MIHLLGAVDDQMAAVRTGEGVVVLVVDDIAYVGLGVLTAPVPDETSLYRHDALVTDLMSSCTVVPFRFGTVVSGVADLESKLSGRGALMPQLFKRLRYRREVGLRVGWPRCEADALGPLSTGAGYLRALREPPELTQLHVQLAGQAEDALSEWDPHQAVFKASYLVDVRQVEEFATAASRLAASSPVISGVSLTGPWAPYSFVGLTVPAPEYAGA